MLFNSLKMNLKLTAPILLTRLLGVVSNIIAMIFIAKMGTTALSASALIMGIFSFCVLLVMSFGFSICALVAEACGSQNHNKVGSIFRNALVLNTLLSIPFMIIFYHISTILIGLHQLPQVSYLVGQYFYGMLIGYLPMIWASILEQLFIGMGKPKYIVYLSIINMLVMPLLSYIFIFGKYGTPALGMQGAGYAVSMTSIVSLLFLFILILSPSYTKYRLFNGKENWLDTVLLQKLFKLGWPIALQFCGEFLAYILMTLMMGWLGMVALAAQQIILQFTTVVVMIPTSVSQATAVLVGQARGKKDNGLIQNQVSAALIVVSALMLIIALIYLCIPDTLAHLYLQSGLQQTAILNLTKTFFIITALSQCFDGARNVLAGAYRGLQETKVPMVIGTTALWLISIPLAYILGFVLHQGAAGVRWGFAIGIMVGTVMLALTWYRSDSRIERFSSAWAMSK